MVHAERAGEMRLQAEKRKTSYFRSGAAVLADSIANGVYGVEARPLSDASREAREEYPRLSKATELGTKYAFWIGTAYLGSALSRHTGAAAGYTIAFAHPFIVGAAARVAKSNAPSVDIRRPSLPLFLASFGILELASTPIFIAVINQLTNMAGSVSGTVAAGAFIAGNAAGLAFEYLGFRFLWKRFILKGVDPGTIADEAKGFIGEFNPLKLLRNPKAPNPARSGGEYIGQLWGIVESLWLWVQLAGVATAVAIAHFYPATPDNFIDLFFQKSALWGKKFLEALALARCCILIEGKTKENNEALGIDKSHS